MKLQLGKLFDFQLKKLMENLSDRKTKSNARSAWYIFHHKLVSLSLEFPHQADNDLALLPRASHMENQRIQGKRDYPYPNKECALMSDTGNIIILGNLGLFISQWHNSTRQCLQHFNGTTPFKIHELHSKKTLITCIFSAF